MSVDASGRRSLDDAPDHLVAQARDPLDRICRLTRRLLKTDTVLVTLVDDERETFVGQDGLPPRLIEQRSAPVSESFSRFPVSTGEPLVVSDSRANPLLRENPVIRQRGVVAYAGAPLRVPDHLGVGGTLCVIESTPREWSAAEVELLEEMARLASDELELHARMRTIEAIETLAARLPEPVERLAAAVRSGASLVDDPDDPRLPRTLDQARARVGVVETLVDDLARAVQAHRADRDEVTDLQVRLLRALQLVTSSARSADLRHDVDEIPVAVRIPARALDRFLSFLLMSAMTHLGEGRHVDVRLSARDGEALLTVSSPGHAMPVGDLLRVVGLLDPDTDPLEVSAHRGGTRVRNSRVCGLTDDRGTVIEVDFTSLLDVRP